MWITRLSVRQSVTRVTDYTICRIYMKFGTQRLYKHFSHVCDFRENRLRVSHVLLKSVKEFLSCSLLFINALLKFVLQDRQTMPLGSSELHGNHCRGGKKLNLRKVANRLCQSFTYFCQILIKNKKEI
jgi:hypothetical protein